jgi:hypothetical protein
MKRLRTFTAAILLTSFVAGPFAALAADSKADKKADKPKPYPLDTCVVSDEKIGGADSGMKPYAFTHEGREIKLCCKGCLKDFNKDKAKYVKKIEAAEKKAKK